jgi:Zn-finger nucleic acid-binding protein
VERASRAVLAWEDKSVACLSAIANFPGLPLELLNYTFTGLSWFSKMSQIQCPKCQGSLETVVYSDIEVDRCTNCKGIWFDSLEAQTLKNIEGSERIDVGSPATGSEFNSVEDINCPKCGTQMTKMVELKQTHIWYEKCPVCYGIWFDAGEFKDFKEEGVLDIFKDIFSGIRR